MIGGMLNQGITGSGKRSFEVWDSLARRAFVIRGVHSVAFTEHHIVFYDVDTRTVLLAVRADRVSEFREVEVQG